MTVIDLVIMNREDIDISYRVASIFMKMEEILNGEGYGVDGSDDVIRVIGEKYPDLKKEYGYLFDKAEED